MVDLSYLRKPWGNPHPTGQGQPGLNVVLPLPTCLDFSCPTDSLNHISLQLVI